MAPHNSTNHEPQKTHLRARFRLLRDALPPSQRALAAVRAGQRAYHLATSLRPKLSGTYHRKVPVIAGYAAKGSELDIMPLLHTLADKGWRVALPVVQGRNRPLLFRAWSKEAELRPGPFGILQPGPESDALTPDILFLPLLAFDRQGTRLGYGGGYYDRSLEALRQGGQRVIAIGIGYDMQQATRLPADPHDAALDFVVTPARLWTVPPAGRT